ncbi:unknown protein [Seminavis robusta]|uniref:Uncharacterized protein n=1 Tax=Seminavis robusta TaxID=568900 RepID=A0A9N8E5V0_9STRA|nr:unknown protein [Seminavis robusta]|eukprot:Sro685_g186850.1 n/a (431) ;mRNA; f:5715-7007
MEGKKPVAAVRPLVNPTTKDDGAVEHTTYEEYQIELEFCKVVIEKLKDQGLDLFAIAKNKLLKVNAGRLRHGMKKLRDWVSGYDMTGIWYIKYKNEKGRSPFPKKNHNIDMDLHDRLVKMKLILPDAFVEHQATTMFCDAFGINEEHYMHGYHRFLDELNLCSEDMEEEFGSDEDPNPITATLARITDIPSSPEEESVSKIPFRRVSLFGLPMGMSDDCRVQDVPVDKPVSEPVDDPVDDPVEDSKDSVLEESEGTSGTSSPSSSSGGTSSPGSATSDTSPDQESNGEEEDSEASNCEDGEDVLIVHEIDEANDEDVEDEPLVPNGQSTDDDADDGELEDHDGESPKKKQKTDIDSAADHSEAADDDTINGDEEEGNEEDNDGEGDTESLGRLTRSDTDSDDDNDGGGNGAGAVVGSYGGVLLSTGSWSY